MKSTDILSAELELNIGTEKKRFNIRVPENATNPQSILPFVQDVANEVINVAIVESENNGKKITCQKGCGACCSQLVPISETEIRYIAKMIKSMPKVKKQKLMHRFKEAKKAFEGAGLWDELMHPQTLPIERRREFGLAYFDVKQDCPFLEDGACSIHKDRPIACREYLVTSDPEFCNNPKEGKIDGVKVSNAPSNALGQLYDDDVNHTSNWVPLIVAPFWQGEYSNLPTKRSGKDWVERFLKNLR